MQKRTLLLLVSTFLFLAVFSLGCSSSRTLIPGLTDVRGIDLRPYAEEGFLITPEAYEGDYDALGQVFLFMYPEAQRGRSYARDPQSGDLVTVTGSWNITTVSADTAVDSLYRIAKSWGADAIMNFRYGLSEHPLYTGALGEPTRDQLMGVRVEGFAIRRKEP